MNFRVGSVIFFILGFFFVKISLEANFQVAKADESRNLKLKNPTAKELRKALVDAN